MKTLKIARIIPRVLVAGLAVWVVTAAGTAHAATPVAVRPGSASVVTTYAYTLSQPMAYSWNPVGLPAFLHVDVPNTLSGRQGTLTAGMWEWRIPHTISADAGTPRGTYTFTVEYDFPPFGRQRNSFNVTVVPEPSFVSANLSDGRVGSSYGQPIQVQDGIPPITMTLDAGTSLPPGLTLAAQGTRIDGKPTQPGSFSFTLVAADSGKPAAKATKTYSMTVLPDPQAPLHVATSKLPSGGSGLAYQAALQATGGAQPYRWQVAAGTLTPGLTLDAASGTLAGQPGRPGRYQFTVEVTDGWTPAQSSRVDLEIEVDGPCEEALAEVSPNRLTRNTASHEVQLWLYVRQGAFGSGADTVRVEVPAQFTWQHFRGVDVNGTPVQASTSFTGSTLEACLQQPLIGDAVVRIVFEADTPALVGNLALDGVYLLDSRRGTSMRATQGDGDHGGDGGTWTVEIMDPEPASKAVAEVLPAGIAVGAIPRAISLWVDLSFTSGNLGVDAVEVPLPQGLRLHRVVDVLTAAQPVAFQDTSRLDLLAVELRKPVNASVRLEIRLEVVADATKTHDLGSGRVLHRASGTATALTAGDGDGQGPAGTNTLKLAVRKAAPSVLGRSKTRDGDMSCATAPGGDTGPEALWPLVAAFVLIVARSRREPRRFS